MHRVVVPVAVLVLATGVMALQGGGGPVTDTATVEKAVLEANARMMQASNSLDADKFFAFILDSDKGPIIQDGQVFRTRAAALDVVRAGFQGMSKIDRKYNQTYVTVISPETALLTASGSYTATLSDGQTVMSGPFAVSLVWVLRDGQWKVLHGHYSTPK